MLTCRQTSAPHTRWGWLFASNTGFKRFLFNNFTYCLTLFSKFFSSFPHGTCSLSVSRQYLALDGIYHPFWSAFPNKPTLGKRITQDWTLDQKRDSHPLWCLVPKDLCPCQTRKRFSKLQFVQVTLQDFKFELFPLHSPLLGESLLVSFPPLIDMLKFSGFSYLIWDQVFRFSSKRNGKWVLNWSCPHLPKKLTWEWVKS